MKESVHLRTFGKGDFRSFSMLSDEDELIIALPHRVSITLRRFGTKIDIDCDLGMTSSWVDFCRVGQIDISQPDYQSAVVLDPNFMTKARSFESHFHVEKFVRERDRLLKAGRLLSPFEIFGRQYQDQSYIHFAKPTCEEKANLEFSVHRADHMDDDPLSEPVFTLCSSVQLRGRAAHYFLFIDWWGDKYWLYEKNFFYNNTVFPPKEPPRVSQWF